MHKWSSRTFRICFHSQMWETQIWWIDQKCRLLLNIIRVRGYRKKINIPSIEHSTDEHPKFHLYRTTLSCKSVYGQVGQPCTGLATIRVHTVTNTSYSRLVVKMWNSLPVDIIDFSSLSRFRRSLCKIYFSEFLTVQYFFSSFFLNLYCL